MRAFIYTRISRDREGAGLGIERQREDCEDLAQRLGWTVADVYSDNDVSAYSGKKRPGYAAMLEALEAGKASAVISWHTDRLHRSPVELESFIDLCDRHKVEIRTVQAGVMDLGTASGKMVARMLGAAARHEVEHSIERQRRAKFQAALEGKFRGGRRSFGYESDGMTIRESEAARLRDAADRILAGVSIAQIVREWNEAGIVTTFSGKEWSTRDFRRMIARPRNAGLITHEGEILGNAQWPAIIEPDTYHALMALLNDPARKMFVTHERKYLGSSLYVCGKCGKRMITASQVGARNAPRRKTYKCSGGAHIGRIAEHLDNYVTELVIARLSRDDAAIALGGPVVDASELQVQRIGIQARLDELASMFADGHLDASQLRRGTESLREKIRELDDRLAEARAASTLSSLVLAEGDIRRVWDSLPVDVRAKVVDALMTVTILPSPRGRQKGGGYFNPEYIRIDWKVKP